MKNKFKDVIERLIYEGYLHSTQFAPEKKSITLRDLIAAGEQEPRIFELLPGLVQTHPEIIQNLKRDLAAQTDLKIAIDELKSKNLKINFRGIPIEDCRKQAKIIQTLYQNKKSSQKNKNLNLRVSPEDLTLLNQLSLRLRKTKSEVIRHLLKSFDPKINATTSNTR